MAISAVSVIGVQISDLTNLGSLVTNIPSPAFTRTSPSLEFLPRPPLEHGVVLVVDQLPDVALGQGQRLPVHSIQRIPLFRGVLSA
jgi:hypothetical protein